MSSFFDTIAPKWDRLYPPELQFPAIDRGLVRLSLADQTILDVGSGTGILIERILPRLGGGEIIALDRSAPMLEQARAKFTDPRIRWIPRELFACGLPSASVDRVLVYNAFPHFPAREALLEFHRLLRPGGALLIWHDIGRETLNRLHREAGKAVEDDVLLPVDALAALAADLGFFVDVAEEDEASYTFLALR